MTELKEKFQRMCKYYIFVETNNLWY
jgi:hypothetical protein